MQGYGFPWSTALTTFAGIPAGVNVTAYFPITGTQIPVTIDHLADAHCDSVCDADIDCNPNLPDGTRIDALGIDLSGHTLR